MNADNRMNTPMKSSQNQVMTMWIRRCLAGLAALGLGWGVAPSAIAVQFDQREVIQNQFILVAAPYGSGSHQLLILQQLSQRRACWREYGNNPVMVEPLLLNFDFTGICDRSTDSNGYSIRIAGQDLGLQYGLRLARQTNDLVLVAYPLRDRSLPTLELGRTNGIPNGFGKIILNPDWRLTRRVYQRRNLPHLYLTRNELPAGISPRAIAARPSSSSPISTTPSARPSAVSAPSPLPVQRPVVPPRPRPGTAVLTAPVEIPVPPPATTNPSPTGSVPPLPVPTSQIPLGNAGTGLPTITINPTPGARSTARSGSARQGANLASALGYNYRVLVPLEQPSTEGKVRSMVPDAFRTRLNGQLMMQVGLFYDRADAEAVVRQLAVQNIPATIVPVN